MQQTVLKYVLKVQIMRYSLIIKMQMNKYRLLVLKVSIHTRFWQKVNLKKEEG